MTSNRNGTLFSNNLSSIIAMDNDWHHYHIMTDKEGLVRLFVDGAPASDISFWYKRPRKFEGVLKFLARLVQGKIHETG